MYSQDSAPASLRPLRACWWCREKSRLQASRRFLVGWDVARAPSVYSFLFWAGSRSQLPPRIPSADALCNTNCSRETSATEHHPTCTAEHTGNTGRRHRTQTTRRQSLYSLLPRPQRPRLDQPPSQSSDLSIPRCASPRPTAPRRTPLYNICDRIDDRDRTAAHGNRQEAIALLAPPISCTPQAGHALPLGTRRPPRRHFDMPLPPRPTPTLPTTPCQVGLRPRRLTRQTHTSTPTLMATGAE